MTKEELEILVYESDSLSGILRKLGKSVSGVSVKLLKEQLDLYNIKYNFLTDFTRTFNYIPLKDVLVENRPYKSQTLKNRLIYEGLKEDKCECCGISSSWNGHPFVGLRSVVCEDSTFFLYIF